MLIVTNIVLIIFLDTIISFLVLMSTSLKAKSNKYLLEISICVKNISDISVARIVLK